MFVFLSLARDQHVHLVLLRSPRPRGFREEILGRVTLQHRRPLCAVVVVSVPPLQLRDVFRRETSSTYLFLTPS